MDLYNEHKNIPSDINLHMPTLVRYATECEHITEIGIGCHANSTIAFIYSNPKKLISYDIVDYPIKDKLYEYAKFEGVDFEYRIEDPLDRDPINTQIEKTDLLFLDGKHSYERVKNELAYFNKKVRKYIGFHDVVSFASRNENPDQTGPQFTEGIVPAIFEFLQKHQEWTVDYYAYYNNGLLILKRI